MISSYTVILVLDCSHFGQFLHDGIVYKMISYLGVGVGKYVLNVLALFISSVLPCHFHCFPDFLVDFFMYSALPSAVIFSFFNYRHHFVEVVSDSKFSSYFCFKLFSDGRIFIVFQSRISAGFFLISWFPLGALWNSSWLVSDPMSAQGKLLDLSYFTPALYWLCTMMQSSRLWRWPFDRSVFGMLCLFHVSSTASRCYSWRISMGHSPARHWMTS